METDHGRHSKFLVMFYELLGTCLFVYGIIMTNMWQSIPFSLFASVLIFGGVTGGHFNPAVSIGVFLSLGDYAENFLFLIMIIFGQVLGGLLAIPLAYGGVMTKDQSIKDSTLCPYNVTEDSCDNKAGNLNFNMDMQVVTNEVICTFIFVSVILMVKGKHTAGVSDGMSGPIAVVLTLLGMIAVGNKFGAAYNPAVGIALIANQVIMQGKLLYLYHYLYAYTLGPALGGTVAGFFHLIHKQLHEPEHHHPDEKQEQLLN